MVFGNACRVIAVDFGERRTGSGRSACTAGDFYPFITEITPPLFGLNRPDPGRTICLALVVLTFRWHSRAWRSCVLFFLRRWVGDPIAAIQVQYNGALSE